MPSYFSEERNIHIVDLINPSEKCLGAAWLFHCTMPNPRGPGCRIVPYESAHCDDNFIGLPDPAFWCGIAMCDFWPFIEQDKVRKIQGMMKEWVVWDRTHLSLPSVPQSHGPGPGQNGQSPAGHGQLTHQGLDGEMPYALIKLMLFVDFLCMDASIAACQRVVSHASWVESHGHLLQGCSKRGVSCPESTGPEAWRYGDKKNNMNPGHAGLMDRNSTATGLWHFGIAMVLTLVFF